MSNEVCQLNVEPHEYEAFSKCEAVVVREYEGPSGRFAHVVDWGDWDDMEIAADRPELLVLPNGVSVIAQQPVLVAMLIQPPKEDA